MAFTGTRLHGTQRSGVEEGGWKAVDARALVWPPFLRQRIVTRRAKTPLGGLGSEATRAAVPHCGRRPTPSLLSVRNRCKFLLILLLSSPFRHLHVSVQQSRLGGLPPAGPHLHLALVQLRFQLVREPEQGSIQAQRAGPVQLDHLPKQAAG